MVDESLGYLPTVDGSCACDRKHECDVAGVITCRQCAAQKCTVYVEPPYNTAKARYTPKTHRYNFKNHLEKHMAPILLHVDHGQLCKMRNLFQRAYRVFFRLYPKRKNFMSYGFTLRKILIRFGLGSLQYSLPTVKTPSKVRECEEAWRRIIERLGV